MFKRMKLASKLAVVIGSVLAVILALLISVTVVMSQTAISESISGELDALSKSNGMQVQQIFDAVKTAAVNMQSYLGKAYKIAETDEKQTEIPKEGEMLNKCQSRVYPKTLSPLNFDVEQYITETARNTAVNNPDIAGMGVMFEQNAFQDNIKDYAFYVSEQDADKKINPFGKYEEYSKESYYKEAADKKAAIVTDPYDFNGIKMVSYSIPIMYNNALQGVIMADIKVTNFDKVNSTSERYKSMYATIYDPDGMIIYDSEDIGNTGRNISEFTPRSEEMAQMKKSMAEGKAFQIETTRENGSKVTRFFNPVTAGTETWWSLTAVDSKDVKEAVTKTIIMLVSMSVAALVLIIIMVVLLLRKMLNPMKGVVSAAEAIVNGDLNIKIEIKSEDEIGILSRSFQKMADNLKAIIADTDYILGEMGNGNFRVKSRELERYQGDYKGLLVAIRQINNNLSSTLSQINQASDQVSSGSEQVSSGAQALSQGATEQASSVE
ncbi:MAG: cache domain-containing protein, partial [Oscillospiraceae bacterium]